MCGHSSCVLSDDEGLQIPQHVACRSTQDLLFCLQSTVTRQQSQGLAKKKRLLILTLNLLQGKTGVNDSLLYEKTSDTWRQWPGGAPSRTRFQQSNSLFLCKSRHPLLDSSGGSVPIGSDNTSPTPSAGAVLVCSFPSRSPGCCWNERSGIVCVFTQIQQRQPGCLLCSAGHVPHAKTPSSG